MDLRALAVTTVIVTGATLATRAGAEAPSRSLPASSPSGPELTMGLGYARAFSVDGATPAATAGGLGADGSLGIRATRWSVAIAAGHAEMKTDAGSRFLSTGARLAFTFHLAPYAAYAPWVRTGLGYRYLEYGIVAAHGIEIAQVLAGVDLRVSPFVTVAPAVGFELDVLPFRGAAANRLESLQASAFLGMLARFDFSRSGE